MNSFTNPTFDEIAIGQSLVVSRTISRTDIVRTRLASAAVLALAAHARRRRQF